MLLESLLWLVLHESPECLYRASVLSHADTFELVESDYDCTATWQLGDDGWLFITTPGYIIAMKIPEDAKSGYMTYHAGDGYAVWNDGTKRNVLAMIFLKDWL